MPATHYDDDAVANTLVADFDEADASLIVCGPDNPRPLVEVFGVEDLDDARVHLRRVLGELVAHVPLMLNGKGDHR